MPEQEDRVRFLANVPLFRGLRERQLQALNKRFVSRRYGAGDEIVTQGKGGAGRQGGGEKEEGRSQGYDPGFQAGDPG